MYDSIILDISDEYKEFKKATSFIDDHEEFLEEVMGGILEYVMDASCGEDALQDFADDLQERYVKFEGVVNTEVIKKTVLEFGQFVLKHLMENKAYDAHGLLCYKLGSLANDIVVLVPLAPDELPDEEVSEDDPDLEIDPELDEGPPF